MSDRQPATRSCVAEVWHKLRPICASKRQIRGPVVLKPIIISPLLFVKLSRLLFALIRGEAQQVDRPSSPVAPERARPRATRATAAARLRRTSAGRSRRRRRAGSTSTLSARTTRPGRAPRQPTPAAFHARQSAATRRVQTKTQVLKHLILQS